MYLFGLPIASVLLFNFATGNEPKGMLLGVVNYDFPGIPKDCPAHLLEDSKVKCGLKHLSCRYIDKLNKTDLNLVRTMINLLYFKAAPADADPSLRVEETATFPTPPRYLKKKNPTF